MWNTILFLWLLTVAAGSSQSQCTLLVAGGEKVGLLTPDVVEQLKKYPKIFQLCFDEEISSTNFMKLSDSLNNYKMRTSAVGAVVLDMKKRDAHISLRGWRNEVCKICEMYSAVVF